MNGPSAGDRLDRDVFGVAGLRYVIWLEGVNDLGACLVSADQVVQGYKDVVERLHAKWIKVIGATLVSSFGSPIASYGFPKIDVERKKINNFIRTGGLFDAVADFDAATLDPATGAMKASMQPNQTTGGPGELLHPNRVGYQAMAKPLTSIPVQASRLLTGRLSQNKVRHLRLAEDGFRNASQVGVGVASSVARFTISSSGGRLHCDTHEGGGVRQVAL